MPILNNLTVNEITTGSVADYYVKKIIDGTGTLTADSTQTTISTSPATVIGENGLDGWVAFTKRSFTVDCSSVVTAGSQSFRNAFRGASISSTGGIDFSSLETTDGYAFQYAFSSTNAFPANQSFPNLETIGSFGFNFAWFENIRVVSVSMPKLTSIAGRGLDSAFAYCNRFTTLVLGGTTAITFGNTNALQDMFIGCDKAITVTAPLASKADIEAMSGYPSFGSYNTVTWNWAS